MTPPAIPRPTLLALAGLLAVVVGWRAIVVSDEDAQRRRVLSGEAPLGPVVGAAGAEEEWRRQLAANPADGRALAMLALELARAGKRDQATKAMDDALRLSPGDRGTLIEATNFYLRNGDEGKALATLKHMAETAPVRYPFNNWDILLAALDSGRHAGFFDDLARSKARVWRGFFKLACERSRNVAAVRAMFDARVKAGVATPEDRGCLIDRLQQANLWNDAYVVWLNGLAPEQRARVDYIFNGSFEFPLSNRGFDWRTPAQEGVVVSTEFADGKADRQVLHVAFNSVRFTAPPVYQTLLLAPGSYRFEARARTNLESWLGLQLGLYCRQAAQGESRRLLATDRLVGLVDWKKLQGDFVIPADCPVQVLRLELAPPRSDAKQEENVPVRLNGDIWLDDFVARKID